MINPNDLREILYNISKNIILPSFGNLEKKQISYKGGKDIVTDIDVSVEKQLSTLLPKLIKNSKFIGEESYEKNPLIINNYLSEEFCWTVDPIDGTSNFAKSKERFAVMVALTKKHKIIQSFSQACIVICFQMTPGIGIGVGIGIGIGTGFVFLI